MIEYKEKLKCGQSQCPSGSSGCEGCAVSKEALLASQDAAIREVLSHIGHKIFVMSGKGGVGKSSVTVNLAAALMAKGYKVGVLDVDIHGPSVPGLLGLAEAAPGLAHDGKWLLPLEHEGLSVVSLNSFLKDRNQAVMWRGPKKSSAIRQFIYDVRWGELDFLLIDSPPGTGDEHMTVLKTIPDVLCLVVTTSQEVALADVRKALSFLRHNKARVLGLVENMSGLSCPHCGGHIDLFKKGGGELLAKNYGIPCLAAIPLDPLTVVAAEVGRPIVSWPEHSAAKESFQILADRVEQACKAEKYFVI